MRDRVIAYSFLILVTLMVSTSFIDVHVTEAQPNTLIPLPSKSVVNKIPEFYAQGQTDTFTVDLSASGGSLTWTGSSIAFTPWGYATTNSSIGTIYVIFLANVTEIDFHLGFLYMTNSSSQFVLKLFDYQKGSLDNLVFDGNPVVYARLVDSNTVTLPNIHIEPKPPIENSLLAIGPDLYVNRNNGLMIDGTKTFQITAIQNELFQGANDYNELWALNTDDSGNYYFGIFYMQNSDQSHVILEHQLRLNDYQTIPGRTFDARWVGGGAFDGYLKVTVPTSVSVVRADGFPFQTNGAGEADIYLPSGMTTIQVPNETSPSPNTEMRFTSWDSYGNQNPLNLTVDSYAAVKANYQTEYHLSLNSQYSKANGAGWYSQGANATFSVPSLLDLNNGTRRVFVEFTGDFNSHSNTGWLVMNSSKLVVANWKTQYEVRVQSVGVPENATVSAVIDGTELHLKGPTPSELWADSGDKMTLQVQTKQIQGPNVNYEFEQVQANGVGSTSITINQPTVITLVYSGQDKMSTSISVKANSGPAISGYPVELTGTLSGVGEPANVTISISTDQVNWQKIGSASTVGDTFNYVWTPAHSGTYFVEASFLGDTQHISSQNVTSVQVQDPVPPVVVNPGNLGGNPSGLVQQVTKQVTFLSFLAVPIGLARALFSLGIFSADSIVPNSPPVLGYFIGSLLVGFVFIFPISATALSIKAARSRRSPSAVWLSPLVTVWLGTLFLVVTNGAFISAPEGLVAASAVLLVSSNALLMPLAFSLFLARAIAG